MQFKKLNLLENEKFKITFICSGNIIRSAYADLVFSKIIQDDECLKNKVEVDSGAVEYYNNRIYSRIVPFILKHNIENSTINNFTPRNVNDYPEILREADVVLVMTNSHLAKIPVDYKNKSYLLYDFVFNDPVEIVDPYFEPPINKAVDMLDHALLELLKIMKNEYC